MRSSDSPILDRDYHYWIVTLQTDGIEDIERPEYCGGVIAQLREQIPLVEVVAVDLYREVGSIDLQTDSGNVRNWSHCFIAELADTASADALIKAADAPILKGMGWGMAECLTSELATRKVDSGTAVPALAATSREMPLNFSAAIEYISIPESRLDDYIEFMRNVFGPVGRWLVTHGHSERIIITERTRSFFHHPSMPLWNQIHILTGDFEDKEKGFHYWTEKAASVVLRSRQNIASAMEPIVTYRRKPRMSKNILAASLTFDADHGKS